MTSRREAARQLAPLLARAIARREGQTPTPPAPAEVSS